MWINFVVISSGQKAPEVEVFSFINSIDLKQVTEVQTSIHVITGVRQTHHESQVRSAYF